MVMDELKVVDGGGDDSVVVL
ncbi:hypothetical protein A2U01_0103263, partial [Trifolium medium]|nr:hypothetical protein [Trifolium medium]